MDFLVVCLAALLASGLTLFSGFGLGTILTPVFALFFPVQAAIAMTAVVHLANNLFKIGLVGRDADWGVVVRFGMPAALASIAGASLLGAIGALPPLGTYTLAGRLLEISPIKLTIGLLILGFAFLELSRSFAGLSFAPKWLGLGGLLSGFFGGLSGNQGALRSAFMIRTGLSKEAFVGTSAVCTVMVDAFRLIVYGVAFNATDWYLFDGDTVPLVTAATLCAFLGAYAGKRLLNKVTLRSVERSVAGLLILIGCGLVGGWL